LGFDGFFAARASPESQGLPDFTELVEKQGPAVVNISTTQTARSNGRGAQPFPFDENDPMYEFFRRFIPRQPGMPGLPGIPDEPREFESRSLGSGFIVSADGYILTNAHVVDCGRRDSRSPDRQTGVEGARHWRRQAQRRGADQDRRDRSADRSFGDPGLLKVGEWVVAIGSPFGFDNSVTAGIVSAKGRSLPQENYVPFIQTDVAVNPGNSGGPLFNMRGEVVGINSQIYSRSGGFMGISFAIPIDVAMDVQAQLRASGKVSRGRIGVVIQDVSKELAESFGLSQATGRRGQRGREGRSGGEGGHRAGRCDPEVRRQAD
jgi:serine protease Do